VRCELQPVQLSERAQIVVYRLVQESLTNIAKYAKAKEVTVRLAPQGDAQVRVSVRDNGVGFDPKVAQPRAHGLLGMRYRIEAEGGTMTVASGSGLGTTIEATLPAAAAPVPDRSGDVRR
jgi:signal transduction histidine kinase